MNRLSISVNAKSNGIEIADMLKVVARNEISGAKTIIEAVKSSLANFTSRAKGIGVGNEIYAPIFKLIIGNEAIPFVANCQLTVNY